MLQADKRQVAQLTSAMIPQPMTAYPLALPTSEAERCESASTAVCYRVVCPDCDVLIMMVYALTFKGHMA